MVEEYVKHDGKLHAIMSLSNKVHITIKFVPPTGGMAYSVPKGPEFGRPRYVYASLWFYLTAFNNDDYVIQFDRPAETFEEVYKTGSPGDEINLTVEFVNKMAGVLWRLYTAKYELANPAFLLAILFDYLDGLEAEDYIIQQFDTNKDYLKRVLKMFNMEEETI